MLSGGSGLGGGPPSTEPSAALYRPPWHGQTNWPPERLTEQPACVQIALKARKSPLGSCSNHAGSPLASVNRNARPGGRSEAATMCRPGSWLAGALDGSAAVVPGAGCAGVGFGVGVVGVIAAELDELPLLSALPITAAKVAEMPARAARAMAPAPPSTSALRCGSASCMARGRIHPSTLGSGQLPASSGTDQANTKTMSEP